MKPFLINITVAVLAFIGGGLIGPAFLRTLTPIVAHYECEMHTCKTVWEVTRLKGGVNGKVDTRWKEVWKVMPNEGTQQVYEHDLGGGPDNGITLSVNPIKANGETYVVAKAVYNDGMRFTYQGKVTRIGTGIDIWAGTLMKAEGVYFNDSFPDDKWTWTATIALDPVICTDNAGKERD